MAAKNVTVIPATISQRTRKSTEARTRRRVAGYARVSTDSDEQFTSYEAHQPRKPPGLPAHLPTAQDPSQS